MDATSISEGLRIARISAKRKKSGWKRYPGSVRQVCDGILRDCWNGQYYQASAGHFCQFYTRDFGIACEGLDVENCRATLSYALQRFSEHGAVTVALTPSGKPFDFPCFSPDSLAFLLRALHVCKAEQLAAMHKDFLEQQINDWCDKVIADDGFVKSGVHFGGMRDHAVRSSSCYDNVMVLLLKREAKALRIKTPDIKLTPALFVKEFWSVDHFRDERGDDGISGDASIVPFWLGIVDDDRKAKLALRKLHGLRMDKPIPLAYSPTGKQAPKMIWQNLFVKDWESDAKWMQLGLMYAAVAKRHDKVIYDEVAVTLRANILKNQNILEVFTPDGKPYTSRFYHADEGMLWGAALARKIL